MMCTKKAGAWQHRGPFKTLHGYSAASRKTKRRAGNLRTF
jgi:hypothetical protein